MRRPHLARAAPSPRPWGAVRRGGSGFLGWGRKARAEPAAVGEGAVWPAGPIAPGTFRPSPRRPPAWNTRPRPSPWLTLQHLQAFSEMPPRAEALRGHLN